MANQSQEPPPNRSWDLPLEVAEEAASGGGTHCCGWVAWLAFGVGTMEEPLFECVWTANFCWSPPSFAHLKILVGLYFVIHATHQIVRYSVGGYHRSLSRSKPEFESP